MGTWVLFLVALPAMVAAQSAQTDTSVQVTWGGFMDAYYAWDFSQPPTRDRSFAGGATFTTQPARHNEFNVNLAFLDARLEGSDVRGRIALQAGTSVQSNYAGEPSSGVVSGSVLSRHIQEAFAGMRLARSVWVDAGVFFSHMGMESWISRENPTYTRSLVAEYSPYYQSGLKLTLSASRTITVRLDVVNGWQNVSENNSGKGVGIRVDWLPDSRAMISYYNFVTPEGGTRLRTLNGLGAKTISGTFTWLGQFDIGSQERSTAAGGTAIWFGAVGIARAEIATKAAIAARLEYFRDDDQIVIATGNTGTAQNHPFRASGASLGVDVMPRERVSWRTELRGFRNALAVFPRAGAVETRDNALLTTSLAVTF
jgi:hypothetical protein